MRWSDLRRGTGGVVVDRKGEVMRRRVVVVDQNRGRGFNKSPYRAVIIGRGRGLGALKKTVESKRIKG